MPNLRQLYSRTYVYWWFQNWSIKSLREFDAHLNKYWLLSIQMLWKTIQHNSYDKLSYFIIQTRFKRCSCLKIFSTRIYNEMNPLLRDIHLNQLLNSFNFNCHLRTHSGTRAPGIWQFKRFKIYMTIQRTWSFTFHQQIPRKMWKMSIMHPWLCTESHLHRNKWRRWAHKSEKWRCFGQ